MNTQIFDSLFQIVNFFNDPQNDAILLRKAGLKDNKNLIPIIVRVGENQEISIGDLASQLGKNHSSTSRQVDRFEKEGILMSNYAAHDKRIRMISLTDQGQEVFDLISAERQNLLTEAFQDLSQTELEEINHSLQVLADAIKRVAN